MRVSVIGAGLGGLCLAQGLRGAGIDVDVYERDPAITARFQGYRLVLNPTGLEALRTCLPQRWHPLLDAIVDDTRVERLVLDPQLATIGKLGPPRSGLVVDRHVLRHLLLTGLTVHTGATLTGYDMLNCDNADSYDSYDSYDSADGPDSPDDGGSNDDGGGGSSSSDHRNRRSGQAPRVEARFAQATPATPATPATADLLVGADGINSAVRSILSPHTVPTDTGVRFVIGRTPLTEPFAALSHAWGGKITGNGVSLLLGAMRFRISPKQAAEELAPEVSLPDTADYVRWAMILPPGGSPGTETPQQAVLSRIEGWHPELRALIEQADPDNSTLLSIRVVQPRERWAAGPVTLLGDAVHATSPTGGNGANTALRDAELLRRCLMRAAAAEVSLLDAVGDYERQMFDYGAEAVRQSLAALPAYVAKP